MSGDNLSIFCHVWNVDCWNNYFFLSPVCLGSQRPDISMEPEDTSQRWVRYCESCVLLEKSRVDKDEVQSADVAVLSSSLSPQMSSLPICWWTPEDKSSSVTLVSAHRYTDLFVWASERVNKKKKDGKLIKKKRIRNYCLKLHNHSPVQCVCACAHRSACIWSTCQSQHSFSTQNITVIPRVSLSH